MLNELFVEISSMPDFDETSIPKAKEIFDEYKNKNTLLNCEFEDNKWTISDEYSMTGLNFQFNEFLYRRFYENIFDMSFKDFTDNVKVFICHMLGKYTPTPIRDFLNDIRRIIETDPENIIKGKTDISMFSVNICLDFFYSMPNENNFELIEAMENSIAYRNSNQRALAEFDTYFLFSDILKDFWAADISKEVKLFFYPLYLWWNITAVIPLRPREFLLTSRDCLSKNGDEYYITVRRNKLKGRRKRGVKYKIAEDYSESTLKITPEIAHQIEEYIRLTSEYEDNEINTLFVTEPHYRKWDRKKLEKSRFYTMQNLYTCLRYFYKEVIEDMYNLKVVNKTEHIEAGEIGKINIGDTRHLALINLMAEGGTPSLAMEMAGHENIDMATHYYSNITNLIECRTYTQYRKVFGGKVQYQIAPVAFFPTRQKGETLVDGNLCYSKEFEKGSITDCLKACGNNGEIGYCPSCQYYRKRGESYYSSDEIYKKKIEEDCKQLAEAVALVRQGKGYKEDIGEAMLRLKSSSLSYSNYLKEKNDGKKENN